MNHRLLTLPVSALMLSCLALAGCNRPADDAGSARADKPGVMARAERKADEMKTDAEKSLQRGKESTSEMAQDAKVAGQSAAKEVGSKVSDAVITTSVNAEIAKDAKLSMLKINVDTSGGRVALRGTAPDAASRDRAAVLAQAVKGVVSVDNQLTIEPAKG